MSHPSRHFCLALLLGLVIGHASVAMHTASHVTGDPLHCELCSTYGNASQVPPPEAVTDVPVVGEGRAVPPADDLPLQRIVLSPRQRAPPASI